MDDEERVRILRINAQEDEKEIIENLYNRQNSYCLKTRDISKDTGISETQILRFCQGRSGIGLSALCRLAREFGYKVTLMAIDCDSNDIYEDKEMKKDSIKGSSNDISKELDSTIEKAYENLANAIILTACDDWKEAFSSKSGIARVNGKTFSIESIEKFFKSDWFKCLTSIDGTYILRKLKQEV